MSKYVMVSMPSHPRSYSNGTIPEHRLIAERALGRLLPNGVVVHHVNGDQRDNRYGNLVICPNESYHRLLHRRTNSLFFTGSPDKRQCFRCDQWLTEGHFSKERGWCDSCAEQYDYQRYHEDVEKSRIQARERAVKSKNRIASYRKANRERINKTAREWRERNRERSRELNRESYARNINARREDDHKSYSKNRESRLAAQKEYYRLNSEHIKAYQRSYRSKKKTEVSMLDAKNNATAIVEIQTDQGLISLSPSTVRKYLVQGNGSITDQEIAHFLALCKYNSLNPWIPGEVHLIKYGSAPATMVVGKDVFLKRAYRSESFRGHKAGVICQASGQGNLTYTEGFCPPGSKIVGGWAEVHRDGWAFPLRVEVDLNEYQAKKSDGTPNRMWSEKPATMVRKVALVQALREAFPDNFQDMYSEEEIPTQEELPKTPVSDQSVIDVSNGSDMRRRSNKYRVDPMIFGSDEIMTCGCTDKQLMALHAAAKADPDCKPWITAQVKLLTGYDQWSYMREDEAAQLLEAVALYQQRQSEQNDPPTASSDPPSKAEPSDPQALPDDLVDCPNGDRVSVSQYCSNCRDRQTLGGCPVVDGEEPMDEETRSDTEG